MIFDMTKRKSGGGGGDAQALLRSFIDGSYSGEYIDDEITSFSGVGLDHLPNLTKVVCHNVTSTIGSVFNGSGVKNLCFPKVPTASYYYQNNNNVECYDIVRTTHSIQNSCFYNCSKLNVLVLRSDTVHAMASTGAISGTCFKSGGTGGTIYIPKSLYDHLGDGTANDYKAATNWSTVDGYGTITWAKIEGSQYDGYYADGTPIPTT